MYRAAAVIVQSVQTIQRTDTVHSTSMTVSCYELVHIKSVWAVTVDHVAY